MPTPFQPATYLICKLAFDSLVRLCNRFNWHTLIANIFDCRKSLGHLLPVVPDHRKRSIIFGDNSEFGIDFCNFDGGFWTGLGLELGHDWTSRSCLRLVADEC